MLYAEKGVVTFCPLEWVRSGWLRGGFGVGGHRMWRECKVHASATQFISRLFSTNPQPKLDVLHVQYLRNSFNRAVTSNLSITALCPKFAASVSPTSVPPLRLRAQDTQVCVHSAALSTVDRHSYFTFCRLQLLRYIFNTRKERGWNAARQSSGGSCVCEQTPHRQPASGLTSHWATEELHTAPQQLLSCSVNKSKPRCNVRSNSVCVGVE